MNREVSVSLKASHWNAFRWSSYLLRTCQQVSWFQAKRWSCVLWPRVQGLSDSIFRKHSELWSTEGLGNNCSALGDGCSSSNQNSHVGHPADSSTLPCLSWHSLCEAPHTVCSGMFCNVSGLIDIITISLLLPFAVQSSVLCYINFWSFAFKFVEIAHFLLPLLCPCSFIFLSLSMLSWVCGG